MFDRDRFVDECRAALGEASAQAAVREVVERAVAHPGAVIRSLGEPSRSGIETIVRSPELTVLNVVWGAKMTLMPHDHRTWATIGIYTGREDNIFWRRVAGAPSGRIEAAGAKALSTGEVATLGRELIHSVTNPIPRLTGAIHVYGGDFFAIERSEWDPESLLEQRYDVEAALRTFEDANRARS